jgi:NAD(P)-dependent dehydrogenase (short-subunit alcohol dehydrogenase family)
MAGLLDGKVVVVTGGASGIGRATALRCAREGATVVIGDVRREPREGGDPTDIIISGEGGTSRFVACDVCDRLSVDALIEAAQELGGIDVLVNNAGLFRVHDFLDVTEAEFDELFDVNVKGVFFAAQAAARHMVPRGSGVIINLSSIAGIQGSARSAVYSATKGAVRLLTMALADALGPFGVRVCAVHPGLIGTSMLHVDVPLLAPESETAAELTKTIPLRRPGTPDDVAAGIVLLACDLASYITGASLLIDGGLKRV